MQCVAGRCLATRACAEILCIENECRECTWWQDPTREGGSIVPYCTHNYTLVYVDACPNGTWIAGQCACQNSSTCIVPPFATGPSRCAYSGEFNTSFCDTGFGCYEQWTGECRECENDVDCPLVPCADYSECVAGVCTPHVDEACECISGADCPEPGVCHTATCNTGNHTCLNATEPDHTPCGAGGSCLAGSCEEFIDDVDCGTVACRQFTCDSDLHICIPSDAADRTPCTDGLCFGGACVDCIEDTDCPVAAECHDSVCDPDSRTCIDQHSEPGAECADGYCNDGTCVECIDVERGCQSPPPCTVSTACTVDNECNYTTACPERLCVNATCRACMDPELDCDTAAVCTAAVCSEYECAVEPLAVGTACADGNVTAGHCSANRTCLECLVNADCDRAGCTEGECQPDGSCVYADCGPGCVHAVGWWYRNAETALPGIAPVTIAGASINISDHDVLRAYISRGYGSNGLDTLASMLLVAKLNIALSATLPIGLVGSMDMADDILAVCPPNNRTVWREILRTSECHGYYATSFQPLIGSLLSFSNGRSDAPLCTDIGTHVRT
jgi:hypothetical protein